MSALPDPLETFRLNDRVAIVTGASSGLGERFARVLAGAGARVVVAARRLDRIEALAQSLPEATAVAADVNNEADLEQLVRTATERYGRIDVLVNNAGTTDQDPALDESSEEFRRVIETNLVAPFLLARLVARRMVEQESGGAIVNIASVNGLLASRSWPETAYTASKGGVVNLTRELANQWAPHGIRVNGIAPGYFESEMTAELFANERAVNWVARHTPLRRHGRVDELDGALLFLASDASSYVTGQLLVVDGGWTIV
jgi:NAD(P)-dependent dehydrogenase (short-subunit alcohol dehydrogenase family)